MEYPDWSELSDVEGEVADHYRALKAENERLFGADVRARAYKVQITQLKEENQRLRKAHEHAIEDCKLLKVTREENERLQEQLQDAIEAMRWGVLDHKDAERYRWLRRYPSFTQVIAMFNAAELESDGAEYLDKAIDAAMKGGE